MRLWGPEMLIVILIIVLLFGTTRIPKLARSLREARQEFEAGKSGEEASEPDAKKSETA